MDIKGKIILVTGATGHQGGSVARALLADGWKVRALTRHLDSRAANELRSLGAEVAAGDMTEALSLEEPLKGCYGVFSVQQPRTYGVIGEVNQGITLIDAAKRAGVKRFVYNSVASADMNTGVPLFDSKAKIEEYLRNSGLDYTVIRPVFFMDNLIDMRDSIYDGRLRLGIEADVPLQMISVYDIGRFVALAFSEPENWIGRTIEIAGDELTGPQMAELLGKAIGRKVVFEAQSYDEIERSSADMAMMYEWFNLKGYSVDVKSVRKIMPDVETFRDWTDRSGWHRAAA
ncbi:MAG: NmrA/HSCARG family protein [Chitinispirillales bacterium]|nr:NmrA/HSCARG family protein [Chitinispirillales bacterium]